MGHFPFIGFVVRGQTRFFLFCVHFLVQAQPEVGKPSPRSGCCGIAMLSCCSLVCFHQAIVQIHVVGVLGSCTPAPFRTKSVCTAWICMVAHPGHYPGMWAFFRKLMTRALSCCVSAAHLFRRC